jgi:hypothetical protein
MIPVEAHLVLNHVPLCGLVFGLLFFVAGVRRSSQAALFAGLRIFVAMGVIVVLVAASGLVSANALADAAWLDAGALSRHRLAGLVTLVVLVALGGFSGVMAFASRSTPTPPRWARTTVLALAMAGLLASLWAAYLGGGLRHSELHNGLGRDQPSPEPFHQRR